MERPYRGFETEMTERITKMYEMMCPVQEAIASDALSIARLMPAEADVEVTQNHETIYTIKFKTFRAIIRESCKVLYIRYQRGYVSTLFDLRHRRTDHIAIFMRALADVLPTWLEEVNAMERAKRRRDKAWLDLRNAELMLSSDFTRGTNVEGMPYLYYNCRAAYELMRTTGETWKKQPTLEKIRDALLSKGVEIDAEAWRTECEGMIAEGVRKMEEREHAAEERLKALARKQHKLTLLTKKAEVMVAQLAESLGCKLEHSIRDNERLTTLDDTWVVVSYKFMDEFSLGVSVPILNIQLDDSRKVFEELMELEKKLYPLLEEQEYRLYNDGLFEGASFYLAYKGREDFLWSRGEGGFTFEWGHIPEPANNTPADSLVARLNRLLVRHRLVMPTPPSLYRI